MEYTTSSENIYFLNDKNIAPGIENACAAGFNAVPSQSAFVEKYGELTGQDGRLCAYIRDDVKVETAALCGEIRALSAEAYGYVDGKAAEAQASCIALGGKISDVSAEVKSLSNTVAADYVRKSGGSVASADITGDLRVGGTISSRYFSTNGIGNTVFSGSEGHGGVKFDFEHGPSDISVDRAGTTLSSFVKGEVKVSAEQAVAIANAYTDELGLSAKNRFEADEAAVGQVSAVLDGRITTAWDQISAKIESVSASIEADLAHGIVSAKTYTDNRLAAKVASLSSIAKSAETGRMLDMIGQADGIITVADRAIISDDIPTLPESKIDGLVLNYATKQEILNAQYTKSQQLKIERYAHDKEGIYLFDHEHSISSRIDCSDFVKDGMIENVELRDGDDEGHSKEDGPYLVITWNADAGKPKTWLAVKKLFNVYKSTDPAGGLSVEGYNIYLNYDVVAKKSSVTPLQEYATQLSSPTGTIQQLSSRISSLDAYSAKQLELDGHIFHAAEGMALKDLIKASARDVAICSTVKNNSMFDVNFEDGNLSALSCSFTTSDGFKLGNRDIVLIHDHDASKAQIQLDDLNTGNVIVVHSGVSRYEFEALAVKTGDVTGVARLSGGNDISGNNSFVNGMLTISSAAVNDTLKVDFTKLVDSATMSSVADISSWLCSQISTSSGGWVQAVAAVRNELCTASCLVSSQSEKADVALSNTLTGVIKEVSSTLSGGISNHVANKNNPHNVTAGLINSYLCSQTSSNAELSEKFKLYALSNDVSSSGQLENKFKLYALSNDVSSSTQLSEKFKLYALSNDVSSSTQLSEKFKTLSTYSETKNQLSVDGYALTSKTSSDVQLKNKFDTLSTYASIKTQLSVDGYTLSSQVAKSAKDGIKIALTKAPAFNTILTGDASVLLDSLDVRTITSVLIDIKKVFAALSA